MYGLVYESRHSGYIFLHVSKRLAMKTLKDENNTDIFVCEIPVLPSEGAQIFIPDPKENNWDICSINKISESCDDTSKWVFATFLNNANESI